MKTHRNEFPVMLMAKTLGVSRSGYYSSLKIEENNRVSEQARFDADVRQEFEESRGTYGRVRLSRAFRDKGIKVNHKRIVRSMRRQKLRARPRRRFRITTNSNHKYPVALNLLDRNFTVEQPDQVYVSDITYLPCGKKWIYLTVFIDLYSRMVVGWDISSSLRHESVLAALHSAVRTRKPPRGLMIHSDRGVQYCCDKVRSAMQCYGYIQSMSRKGNCWDNAVSESFFSTLKTEMVRDYVFNSLQEAEELLFDYIEVFYNRKRLHSTLGYVSPATFEEIRWKQCA